MKAVAESAVKDVEKKMFSTNGFTDGSREYVLAKYGPEETGTCEGGCHVLFASVSRTSEGRKKAYSVHYGIDNDTDRVFSDYMSVPENTADALAEAFTNLVETMDVKKVLSGKEMKDCGRKGSKNGLCIRREI